MNRILQTILFLILAGVSFCQDGVTYFNNVNSELCYELYRTGDQLGNYRVYIVIDEETTLLADTMLFNKWHKLSQAQRSSVTQRWSVEGRRIEAERAPYITKPAVFPKHNKVPLIPVKIRQDWTAWEVGREFWAYPDRPF